MESGKTSEETSGCAREERVNKWHNFMIATWLLLLLLLLLLLWLRRWRYFQIFALSHI